MKKWIIALLAVVMLTGCSFTDRSIEKDKAKRYESLWNSILSQDRFKETSTHFTIKASVVKAEDGYSVDVAIDKPTVAMFNVEVLALVDNQEFDASNMMPSAGILDGEFNMIPNQARPDKGFIGGIRLNGLIPNNESNANVKVLVSWKDEKKQKSNTEFFEYNLVYVDAAKAKADAEKAEAEAKAAEEAAKAAEEAAAAEAAESEE